MMRFSVSLTAQQQRLAAISLALVLIAGLGSSVYSFATAQIEHHRRVSLLSRKLSAQRSLLTHGAEWRAQLFQVKSSSQWQKLFVSDTAESQNGPASQLIAKHGGTIGRSQVKRFEEGSAIELDEQVSFTADITALSHILHAMRSSEPLFVIRNLDIHDVEPKEASPRKAPNALQVELSVAEFAVGR